ncbi:SDR family NAD(P)-dependent oxidoreductase [Legionella israelensis]|uniref:Oxidoreductase with NAD(P)-binding Rossmann-fold domain protein n=1 Tax=Legionella israelensis TaxID=454 RepID=A0A0W0VRJ6_9GAMM|nr:SDR family NAD(P)-dependent oxidoreductase [Legionella israelensis]KTD22839.1 oxidoreductase with NAD(P)-binding Rossmann-fold domain protein [Legionella israelensis]QBS09544.1 SDR family NAD(P)-dependent oxidoreductase [Legionella israelensis]SCY58394.1 Short-chain dehydrogenase [Legionella israelensis DSM 19235]STX60464.1 oxidoreductase with NAD(P)-binding Rossmann-fold domain [Legionella israelensis]
MSKTVFISGCSTGIGFFLTKALHEKGFKVIASCRKTQDVMRLQALGINTLQMDVSDSSSIKKAVEKLLEHTSGKLDILINNAGFGQAGALEDIGQDVMLHVFQTNVFGLHELTRQIIPVMRAQGSGRIINISSILGLVSLPFRGAYNASKYAVEGLSDTLRLELEQSNIWVSSIQPGPIESNFRDTVIDTSLKAINIENSFFAPQYKNMLLHFKEKKKKSAFTQTPEAVFKKVLHAIESKRPKPVYKVTLSAYLLALARRVLPNRLLHRLLAKIAKNELS